MPSWREKYKKFKDAFNVNCQKSKWLIYLFQPTWGALSVLLDPHFNGSSVKALTTKLWFWQPLKGYYHTKRVYVCKFSEMVTVEKQNPLSVQFLKFSEEPPTSCFKVNQHYQALRIALALSSPSTCTSAPIRCLRTGSELKRSYIIRQPPVQYHLGEPQPVFSFCL